MFNKKNPTFFQKQGTVRIQSNKEQYTEILALGSPNMADKVRNFQVLNDHIMDSDHCPIYFDLKLSGHTVLNSDDKKVRLNFAKAVWVQFNLKILIKNYENNITIFLIKFCLEKCCVTVIFKNNHFLNQSFFKNWNKFFKIKIPNNSHFL